MLGVGLLCVILVVEKMCMFVGWKCLINLVWLSCNLIFV